MYVCGQWTVGICYSADYSANQGYHFSRQEPSPGSLSNSPRWIRGMDKGQ